MRHKIELSTIINPRQRVPELTVVIERQKLVNFILENKSELSGYVNILNVPIEKIIEQISVEFRSSLKGFSMDHQKEQMTMEVANRVWDQQLKPKLVHVVYDDIVEQAISYTHKCHLVEVPFEDGKESRERLKCLVNDVITERKILSHPVLMKLAPTYQIVPEDLQIFLDRIYTETVRDIFAALDDLEQPLEEVLYKNYFNDSVPIKFSIDMVQRFHQGQCQKEEIVAWALERPDYWMHELLGNCSRNIDRDLGISGDEKLTQKAAAYQLLKAIFLNQEKE